MMKAAVLSFLSLLLLLAASASATHLRIRSPVEESKKKHSKSKPHSRKRASKEIGLEDTPLKVHRIAAQMLEDERNTELAPTWNDNAVFDPTVRILYRPDIKGPAYYEFRVTVGEERMGHIIVSTGEHDFPVSHWSSEGTSPTESLDNDADGAKIVKYYKVDTLSYVAEDKQGNIVAKLGELPPRIESQHDLNSIAETTQCEFKMADDSTTEQDGDKGRLPADAPEALGHSIQLKSWGDSGEEAWKQLKSHYAKTYGPMAQSLKKAAAGDWETDNLAETYGEGLVVGKAFKMALLYPDASIHASGKGTKFVSIEQVKSAHGHDVLLVVANEADEEEELPLQVSIDYGKGLVENVPFMIIPQNQVPEKRDLSWTDWTFFNAGSDSEQRIYTQIRKNTGPNTSSCRSGCGATAWAMLFGWIDNRASFDSKWSDHRCLYLQNGGISTPDVIAPKNEGAGVRNMMWEIRNDIGTFCWGDSGATFPWNMIDAYKYVKPRCGYSMTTDYHPLGISTTDLRKKARNAIRDYNTPAIIGTGWLSHYPLAYGYAWRKRTVRKCFIFCWNETEYSRWFKVNQGWGSASSDEWIPADTWFVGQFFPR